MGGCEGFKILCVTIPDPIGDPFVCIQGIKTGGPKQHPGIAFAVKTKFRRPAVADIFIVAHDFQMFDVFPVDQIPGSAVSQGVAVPVIGKKQPVDALSIFQDIRITDNVPEEDKDLEPAGSDCSP